MNKHRSFRASDFSLRDIPGFLVVYGIIAVFSVFLGLIVEGLPDFWRGALFGAGITMTVSCFLMRSKPPTDPASNAEK